MARKRPTRPAPAPAPHRLRRRSETAYDALSPRYRRDLAAHGINPEDWMAGYGRRRGGGYEAPPLESERTRRDLVEEWSSSGNLGVDTTEQALRWAVAQGGTWDNYSTEFLALAMTVPEPPDEWIHVQGEPHSDGPWVFTVETPSGFYTVPVPAGAATVVLHGLSVVKHTNSDFDYDVSGTPRGKRKTPKARRATGPRQRPAKRPPPKAKAPAKRAKPKTPSKRPSRPTKAPSRPARRPTPRRAPRGRQAAPAPALEATARAVGTAVGTAIAGAVNLWRRLTR